MRRISSQRTARTARRPFLRALVGAGLLGAVGFTGTAVAAIPGVDVTYRRCKVAFVSNASAIDAISVYYADRDGIRQARYDIAPTTTDPRGHAPLVVEYDPGEDRTHIQVAAAQASLVCVVAEAGDERTVVTNPNGVCVPEGFNTAPTASFTVSESPTVDASVTFTSTATDPDDPDRLFYEWDLDGDGVFETGGATASTTYTTAGDVTVTLRVTDDFGTADTASQTVTVDTDAPAVPSDLVARLAPDDLGPRDFFGWAVAASADYVAVGARNNNSTAGNAGAVYVYDRRDLSASPTKLDPAGTVGSRFGSALAITDDRLVVGEPTTRGAGAVYVYDLTDLSATPTTLAPSGGRANYGWAIATDGDTLAVGAPYEDSVGAVYVHDLSDLSAPPRKVTDTSLTSSDVFGWCVSVSGDVLAVGAPQADDPELYAGAAYVYDLRDLSAMPTKLLPTGLETRDAFGYAVSVDGDTLAVSARFDDDAGENAGAVYVYDPTDLAATPTKVVPDDLNPEDVFGYSLTVVGDSLLVGAESGETDGTNTGVVYVYDLTDLSTPQTKLAPDSLGPNGRFGSSVVLVDDVVVVGARYETESTYQAGAAYVYQ